MVKLHRLQKIVFTMQKFLHDAAKITFLKDWASVGQLASKLQAVRVGGLKKILPTGPP